MLTLRLLERVREVPKEDWDALLGPDASPFVEWTWLDCLEEAGCVSVLEGGETRESKGAETGWIPRHLALFRDDKLVAAAPAYVKLNSEGEFVFDWAWADLSHRIGVPYYPKIVLGVPFTPVPGERVLVGPGEDRAVVVRVFAKAVRDWARELNASSVHVLFTREDETSLWVDAGYTPRLGYQYHFFRGEDRTFEDYVTRYKSKKRNQIRREVTEPAKAGVTVSDVTPEELTPALAHTMHGFYASTVDKYFYGRHYLTPRFFELVTERFRDRLAWVVARREGEPIAGAFNVQKGKRLYGRYWGALADVGFLHFNVCYYHGIRRCLDQGLDVFEPGAGGEHKRARGFVPTLTHSVHWIAHPKLRGILDAHLVHERAKIEEFVRTGGEGND